MARRMLDSGIWANEHFAELCPMARLLQIGIINLADDQGRMKANPAYLRSQVFPYDDVSFDEVAEWLDLIAGNGTVQRYEVDGKVYLQLLNWWEYQSLSFASPSDYPAPTGWVDRIRYTAKGRIILTYNWLSTTGERSPDTCDASGKPIHPSGSVPVPTNGQPPSAPGSALPSQSGSTATRRLKEDKDKDKDKEEEENPVSPPPPASQPKALTADPAPTAPWQSTNGQYQPGLPDPRPGWVAMRQNGLNHDLAADIRMPLSRHIARALHLSKAFEAGDDTINDKVQRAAVSLHRMGCTTEEQVEHYGHLWESHWQAKDGTPAQFVAFVSQEMERLEDSMAEMPPPGVNSWVRGQVDDPMKGLDDSWIH